MNLLGKIKYVFDRAEEANESGLMLSRRKFFIGSAALIVAAPILVDGLLGEGSTASWDGKLLGIIGEGTDFLSPGALSLLHYEEELLKQSKQKFVFKQMFANVTYKAMNRKFFETIEIRSQHKVDELWDKKIV